MPADRQPARRPYFFEVFTLLNFVAILLLLRGGSSLVLQTISQTVLYFGGSIALYAAIGIALRAVDAARTGRTRAYLHHLRTPGWLSDSLRLFVFACVLAHTYSWIKLVVPLLHPRLYDKELWQLDQAVHLGFSPNVLFLNLFAEPLAIRFIDWSYAKIFVASLAVAFGFFLSSPSRRLRIAFMTGNVLMWLAAAWLYLLIPSLGPAYHFQEVWAPVAHLMPHTVVSQAALIRNYQAVLQLGRGAPSELIIMFGIAAFPSLHVGFQTFAFLWMRKVWIYGQIVFGVFAFLIFVGCVVTGWHYLVDAYAGIALALAGYLPAKRMWRIGRWVQLRDRIRARATSFSTP